MEKYKGSRNLCVRRILDMHFRQRGQVSPQYPMGELRRPIIRILLQIEEETPRHNTTDSARPRERDARIARRIARFFRHLATQWDRTADRIEDPTGVMRRNRVKHRRIPEAITSHARAFQA